MKKYLTAILILFCSSIFAQENYKGKISLIFNDEKIELPINFITLRKADDIIISVRAALNNEKIHQMITLEWQTENLSASDSAISLYNNFKLAVASNKGNIKDDLNFRMDNDGKSGRIFVRKGNRTWELFSFALKFNIEKVSFENSSIIIKGDLSFKARDKNSKTPLEPISEIKDCKFEIII